jgi:hypothetical protein
VREYVRDVRVRHTLAGASDLRRRRKSWSVLVSFPEALLGTREVREKVYGLFR